VSIGSLAAIQQDCRTVELPRRQTFLAKMIRESLAKKGAE